MLVFYSQELQIHSLSMVPSLRRILPASIIAFPVSVLSHGFISVVSISLYFFSSLQSCSSVFQITNIPPLFPSLFSSVTLNLST